MVDSEPCVQLTNILLPYKIGQITGNLLILLEIAS